MANIDIGKLIGDFLSFEHKVDEKSPYKEFSNEQKLLIIAAANLVSMALKDALKKQGLEYKDGEVVEIADKPVNFEDFPREEQLKWYICTKSVPHKDNGGFMPLFCEGEPATLEKIKAMIQDLDLDYFVEHFRNVTDSDISSIKDRKE